MRTFRLLVGVVILLSVQVCATARAKGWQTVEFKDSESAGISAISDGSRVYAYTGSQFFLMDNGSAKPVKADGEDFVLDVNTRAIVGGRFIGTPAGSANSPDPEPQKLFVLDGAAARPITLEGKQILAAGRGPAVAVNRDCPFFAVFGGDFDGLYKLDGAEATVVESPKFAKGVALAWSQGRLVLDSGSNLWVWIDDEMTKVVDESGEPLKSGGSLSLVGDSLAMTAAYGPASVYQLSGSKATSIEFGEGVQPKLAYEFMGSMLMYCESGTAGDLTGMILELSSGKTSVWKPSKRIKEKGVMSMFVCDEAGLLAVSGNSETTWYRFDEKSATKLSFPKDFQVGGIMSVAARGEVLACSIGVRGLGQSFALIDEKGKVELQQLAKDESYKAAAIELFADANGFYAVGTNDIAVTANFTMLYQSAK